MTNITDDLTRTLIMIERALKLRLQLNDLGQAAPGVTLNQAVLLSQIAAAGNLATVSGLSGARKRPVHTLTTAVDGVEKKGWYSGARSRVKLGG
jgi:DNA-binding MarR family transcriptional regulator